MCMKDLREVLLVACVVLVVLSLVYVLIAETSLLVGLLIVTVFVGAIFGSNLNVLKTNGESDELKK